MMPARVSEIMAKLKILEFPDPRLRTKASPVETVDDELRTLIDDMFETMYDAPGIGLAATQVDVHKRLLVADVSPDKSDPHVLINPEIIEKDGVTATDEIASEDGTVALGRTRDILPAELPDLFEGDRLVLLGQYVGAEPITFKL